MANDNLKTEADPEAPPLWGEAIYRRAVDGAADIHAQVKVDGESVRIEAAAFIEKGETLTGPNGQLWVVVEAKHRADGGYSWASLAPASPPPAGEGAAEQQALNQIEATPETEPRAPRSKKPKVTDAEPASDATESGSAEPED